MYISQLTDEDSFAQSLNKDRYVQYALRILKKTNQDIIAQFVILNYV